MNLIFYTGALLSFFKDKRVIDNIGQMIKKMIEQKTTRLYTIAQDKKEYNRFKSLLDGSLKSVLNNEKISLDFEKTVLRPCLGNNISLLSMILVINALEYSKELENLGKVLDLDKNVVNGYYTFKSKAIDDDGKRWNDVDTKVYSNREPQFVSQEELKLYNKGTLQNSEATFRRERAEIIQQLVDADDYINTSEVN